MLINPTHQYKIRRKKERKVNVIMAGINRVYGVTKHSITRSMVLTRLNKNLHDRFEIKKLADLEENQFEQYIEYIDKFKYQYNGEFFG